MQNPLELQKENEKQQLHTQHVLGYNMGVGAGLKQPNIHKGDHEHPHKEDGWVTRL